MNLIKTCAAVILSAAVLFASAAALSAAQNTVPGDVDGDGAVTLMDATAVQMVLAYMAEPGEGFYTAGDVDLDDEVTIADATLIQRYEAQIITVLPFTPYSPTEAPPTEAPTQAPNTFPTDSEGWGTIIIRP